MRDLVGLIENFISLDRARFVFSLALRKGKPYYLNGPSLYLNSYDHDDHEKVSEEIKKIRNARWLVSYDNTEEIRRMYRSTSSREFHFIHTARQSRKGKEILFFSRNLAVPRIQPVS